MFKNKTTFILGAGASAPYGYPLGKKLISDIMHAIANDYIFINEYPPKDFDNFSLENYFATLGQSCQNAYNSLLDKDSLRSLSHSGQTFHCKIKKSAYAREFVQINNSLYGKFSTVKLSSFPELANLFKFLHEFDPLTIDSFLRDHHQFREIGRLMIAYVLLKCEKKISFSKDYRNPEFDISDNWYSHLIHDIKSDCQSPDDILNNKVNFITFNYDISLEYYLFSRLILPI